MDRLEYPANQPNSENLSALRKVNFPCFSAEQGISAHRLVRCRLRRAPFFARAFGQHNLNNSKNVTIGNILAEKGRSGTINHLHDVYAWPSCNR
jgi:hypothetical protein